MTQAELTEGLCFEANPHRPDIDPGALLCEPLTAFVAVVGSILESTLKFDLGMLLELGGDGR